MESGKLSVELENLTISEAVSDTLNTIHGTACEAGVSLSCQLPSGLPAAYADPTRLRQILVILVDNAIKFTPFGGSVRVQVRYWEKEPEFLCIEVSDTGCGIEPDHIDRVFERLYETLDDCHPSGGLGLGLFICNRLVKQQGGQMWVESELQKGSTFSFTLPLFSLKKLLVPLLRNDKWPRNSAALIQASMSMRDPAPARDAQEIWSREVRSLVRSCIMPNLDVLLPRMSRRGSEERFRVLAFADEKGAAILASRIRDQFEHFPHLTQVFRNLKVTYSMLHSPDGTGEISGDDIVNTLIENLEETIRGHDIEAAHLM